MSCWKRAFFEFFEYDTPYIVHIKSKTVGTLCRLVEIIILAYVIGYVLVYKKGYQVFSDINSSVTTKLKGIAYPNFTDDQFQVPHPEVYRRIWDVADYVVPPQENGAFFVTTNVVITPNQTQGKCAEDYLVKQAVCDEKNVSTVCIDGKQVINGNGVMTGKCVPSIHNGTKTCEIWAWCPTEINLLPLKNTSQALLADSKSFTVMIKNSIEFPKFKIRRRNVLNSSNSSFLESCLFDPDNDLNKSCPIFQLGTIVEEAGENYDELAVQGGVIAIIINWDCNLDFDPETHCNPTYTFSRLDDPQAKIAKGWNFRYANHYSDNMRTLYKSYGIRFVVLVQGQGGKFNVVPLLQNVGAGLALLGISTVVCDIVVLYFSKDKKYYQERKFIQVDSNEKDEFLAMQSSQFGSCNTIIPPHPPSHEANNG